MNWYNELCNNGLKELPQPEQERPLWATHMFKRMGRVQYGTLFTDNWIWVNEDKTLYYTSDDIDYGSLKEVTK